MLARSRRLTPGPRDLAGPDLRARAPLLPERASRVTGSGGAAPNTGIGGLLGLRSVVLGSEATVRLLSPARPGGRHIAGPACTAPYGAAQRPNDLRASGRASEEAVGAAPPPPRHHGYHNPAFQGLSPRLLAADQSQPHK